MLAETAPNPAQLCRPLRNVSATDIIAMLDNQRLNFILESAGFLLRQRDLALSIPRPNQSSIECFRSKIRGEQGNRRKPNRFRRPDRGPKMTMIGFLHRHAAGNRKIRPSLKDRRNSLRNQIETPVDPPDTVMHLARAVHRYDDVIKERGDFVRTLEQQQTRS
jgi:hypothetical protein